jgi:hypothetical protein
MAFSDARNERDRADTGRNSNNHGGGADRGTKSQQQDRRNMDAARAAGNRAPGVRGGGRNASGMSSAAADHLVAMGRVSTPSIPGTGVAQGNYSTQDQAYADYAKSVGQYANRGFIDRAMDWLGGGFYDPKEPMAGNPRSFAGGDFHSTTNPGSVLGGLAGLFGGGVGSVLGKIAGPAYTAAGLPEIWHGGYGQPDMRTGPLGNTTNPMGGTMADIGGGHTYPSGGAPGGGWAGVNSPQPGGGTGNGGQFVQAPGVQPIQAAGLPQAPAAQQPGLARFGMPGGQMNVPGPSQYGVNLPSYGYFGSPGMQMPKSAIMGGI